MFTNFVIKSKTRKLVLNSSKVCMSGSQNGQEPCEVKSETKVYAINTILKICQGSLNLCERGWGLWNMFYKKKS